jgi:hypothetical protein
MFNREGSTGKWGDGMNMMFSSVFPKGHFRAGEQTDFIWKIFNAKKVHTIRENYDYWSKHSGKRVNLCAWDGKPYNSKSRCFASAVLRVEKIKRVCETTDADTSLVFIEKKAGFKFFNISAFADDDGLTCLEFWGWFPSLMKIEGAACVWLDDVGPAMEGRG